MTGTNDFGHDSGPAWEAAFSKTYVEFVSNVTTIHYKNAKLPIFVAQGPMNNSPQLHDALQVAITAINAAGGNAIYLDLRGPPNDGASTHPTAYSPPPPLPSPNQLIRPSQTHPRAQCGGHPGVEGHSGMAALAIPAIATAMGWTPSAA